MRIAVLIFGFAQLNSCLRSSIAWTEWNCFPMRLVSILFFSVLLAAGAIASRAQVVPSATARQLSVTAGGMVSIFQPDFEGQWACAGTCQPPVVYYPVAQASGQPLFGLGAYVDVKLNRWAQIEAEARWLRFNQYANIYQDNYLIGPRLPVYHFWRSEVYAKTLVGVSKMNFYGSGSPGTFTDIAFGGGMDVKLNKRLSLRAVDFEYQYWPTWGNSTLSPYGASVGVGYRIF